MLPFSKKQCEFTAYVFAPQALRHDCWRLTACRHCSSIILCILCYCFYIRFPSLWLNRKENYILLPGLASILGEVQI